MQEEINKNSHLFFVLVFFIYIIFVYILNIYNMLAQMYMGIIINFKMCRYWGCV